MSQTENIKGFWERFRKPICAVIIAVVSLLFIGSLFLAVFIGGELTPESETVATKGLLRIDEGEYSSSYIKGDKFNFNKDESKVLLVAKDTVLDKVVKIDDLPGQEYGFRVNGEGDIIYDPSQITIDENVKTVDVVSKQYPDVKTTLDINVYASLDESKLGNSITMEAELADLYTAGGELLTQEQKATLPDTNKPYISSEGATPDGLSCSGGACIRNFSSGMKMEFTFASSVSGKYELTIKACKRPSDTEFDSGVNMLVNGAKVATGVTVPGAGSGYFSPYEFTVEINVQRGLNTIVFESIGANCNLDALVLTAAEGVNAFGSADAVGPLLNVEPEEPEEPEQPEEQPSEEQTPEEEQPSEEEGTEE